LPGKGKERTPSTASRGGGGTVRYEFFKKKEESDKPISLSKKGKKRKRVANVLLGNEWKEGRRIVADACSGQKKKRKCTGDS